MEQPNRFWYLRNPYAWIVLGLGVVTAVIIREAWVILVGVIGYELALLIDLTRGQSLGRSGRIRLARLEQEYRELKSEQVRLIGAIEERDERLKAGSPNDPIPKPPAPVEGPAPDPPAPPTDETSPEGPEAA